MDMFAVADDVADRFGRLATVEKWILLDAVCDYMAGFDSEDMVSEFVDRLLAGIGRAEEMAA